jgi:hypothetical protein
LIISPDEIEEIKYEDFTSNSKKVKKLLEKKIEENFLPCIKNDLSLLQPDKYSYGRNSYAHILKELKSEVDMEK